MAMGRSKKVSNFLYVLISIIVIVPSHAQPPNETTTWNVLRTINGGKKFLKENERFLNQEKPDTTPQSGATYDFIVIGGGTAGATIAARLSEIPRLQVLLIEAGPHESLFMDIPLVNNLLLLGKHIQWDYQSEPSGTYCLGMKDTRCGYTRGKVIGGSSVINYMIANRGSAEDYDHWEEMGNEGWAYQDVLKYFKKLETINIPRLRSDTVSHGTDGPVYVSSSTFRTPYAEAFLKTVQKMGYPLVDYNGNSTMGFSYIQSTTKNGTRMSSNRAYLHPARDRENLCVTYESTVKRILIDPGTKRAYGVEFTKNGETIHVFASKEVILSAGTIGSPQLLMLSGVGPAGRLTELGINVIRDAPVGENMMDHLAYMGLTWITSESAGFPTEIFNPAYPYLGDFLIDRSGPYTVPGTFEALGFINTKQPEKRDGSPDIELLLLGGFQTDALFPIILNINDTIRQTWSQYVGESSWSILPVLLKPESRGRIILRSNDVNVKPEIVPNFFNDTDDIATFIAGIKMAIEIGNTMEGFDSQLLKDVAPGCKKYEYGSDDYWECAIRTLSMAFAHVCGTCKMGCENDTTAIVNPELKVIGIQGLRIVDASIMPEIPAAHTNIPVYMIAEKAADMIKSDWVC